MKKIGQIRQKLSYCLAEPIVGKEFITKILHSIQSALPPPDKRTCMPQNELDKCVSFVSDVAVLLYREMKVYNLCAHPQIV